MWLYEFPFDTVRAISQLVYAGALERYPGIRFQFAHLGGAAPFLAHRLASLADREPAAAAAAPAGALEYLRRLYYDTGLSNNAPALAATREVTELGRIVFGTDWPYAALPTVPTLRPTSTCSARAAGPRWRRRTSRARAAARRRARLNRTMPALVVLGARNLGGAILDRFLADGWEATAIVRSAETAEAVEARGAHAIRADVTDPSQLHDALAAAGPVDCS